MKRAMTTVYHKKNEVVYIRGFIVYNNYYTWLNEEHEVVLWLALNKDIVSIPTQANNWCKLLWKAKQKQLLEENNCWMKFYLIMTRNSFMHVFMPYIRRFNVLARNPTNSDVHSMFFLNISLLFCFDNTNPRGSLISFCRVWIYK